MTLEEALIKIKEEQKVDLFNNKDKVLDMLSDLIPGESDARKIKNRVKWAYEQGAIKALASTPDHVMARNKAIAILKANTDLNEAAISDTIDSFCMALQWKDAVPTKVQNSPMATSPAPTTKPVSKPTTQPISSPRPPRKNNTNTATPRVNTTPKGFGYNSGQITKNALINNVKNIIDGNIDIDDYVKKRSNSYLSKNIMRIFIHFLAQIIFFCIICVVDTNNLTGTSGILYTVATLFFFLWEGCSFARNITVSSTKLIRLLLPITVAIVIAVVYFIVPANIEGFDDSDFKLFLQAMFWTTMLLGNIGRFIRLIKP